MSRAQHFSTLNGLRGVCALIVPLVHVPMMTHTFGFSAVDLFFILSGVVLANSWEQRLQAGGEVRSFLIGRLRRLMPLAVLGMVLGLIANQLTGEDVHAPTVGWNLLLLPNPFGLEDGIAFTSNVALWSLSAELLVNILYAFMGRHLTNRVLTALVLCSALFMVGYAFKGLHGGHAGWANYNLVGGYGRVMLGFFAGVALCRAYRAGLLNRLPCVSGAKLLMATVVLCGLSGDLANKSLLISAVLCLVYPLLVALAMRSTTDSQEDRIYTKLADLSYPVYVLHVPVLKIVFAIGLTFGGAIGAALAVPVAYVLFLALAQTAVDRWDRPIRAALQQGLRPATGLGPA